MLARVSSIRFARPPRTHTAPLRAAVLIAQAKLLLLRSGVAEARNIAGQLDALIERESRECTKTNVTGAQR
jgi:hypothetical protein